MKRFFACLFATVGLAGLVVVSGTGAGPVGAAEPDEPVSPIYDCAISPPAPGDVSSIDDVPIPIDVDDRVDPVAPGATAVYDVDLELPNIGENPGLGLIGITNLTVSLPRPGGLSAVDIDVSGTPNPPLADWQPTADADSLDVSYVSTYGPGANSANLIKLQADGDFVYKFNTDTPVVPPDVTFTGTTTTALAGEAVEWTVPNITADLLILGQQHDFTCVPEAPSTVIVHTDVCAEGGFTDVGITNPFYCDISWMAKEGISTGFEPGPTYRPSVAVSRQAMSAFLYRFAGSPEFIDPTEATFGDVSPTNQFFTEIEWMAAEGISTGTAASPKPLYKPSDAVSRGAMAAFLFRGAGPESFPDPATATFGDVPTTHPFFTEVEWMADTGISTGTPASPKPLYKPADPVSRQAMSAFLHRVQIAD